MESKKLCKHVTKKTGQLTKIDPYHWNFNDFTVSYFLADRIKYEECEKVN